jgi:formamidopyrimidine-DNA glycosylase
MNNGLTLLLEVKGSLPVHYREAPKSASLDWPPKFMKVGLVPDSSPTAHF